MRTFGTETDNLILEEYHAGINRYNVILYHNGKKIDPYIKKLTAHFMGNSVPFGNISKHYFELNTDYMDFLEKDEVEVRIEKNGVEIKVCTFYIKTINKGEYMASYTAFSSLLEPEKIALYKIDEDPEWRVAWNNSAKTIKEILDIFLKPANLAMAEYPSYDGTFVSLHEDWENMTLSQLICACGILEGCNYVLIGNTFYPVRPSKAVAKSYDIGECVYSENLWQRKTDLCCGKLDVGIKVWEYENYTSEDPLMGSVVSFMESSIEYNNPSSGTGVISANFPLIPGENSSKIKEYMISKLSPFIGMDMNSYTIEYLGDAFIEPGDKVKFYDDSRLVQFYPSEIIWEWDGGLRCTLKSEIVQESGTTEADVSLNEIVNTINSVANTLQNVRYNTVTTKTLEADAANIGLLKAEQADIKYATIQSLNATDAKITTLDSTTIKTDELYAKVAELDYIKSDHADIANLKSTMITADNLRTEIAKIGYLTADEADIRYLTVSTADTKFLHADMSDMDISKIQTLFATAGIVSDMTIKDGHITGVLDSVTVNANSITTGTLSVDRLVIRGSEKSLVYELNNISGALQAKSVDTLNGEILTQRTITADKLVAKSITSNEIKAGTITSDEIAAGTIKAANINVTDLVGNSAFINSLKSNTVIVGLQNDINGISVGGRNLVKGSTSELQSYNYPSSNFSDHIAGITTTELNAGTYTMSFWAKSTVDGDRLICHLYNPSNVTWWKNSQEKVGMDPDGRCVFKLSTSLTKYWVTYTVTRANNRLHFIFARLTSGYGTGTVSIGSCKLEEGNKATDWTPAPEDVDSLISAAQSTANSANSLASTANGTANSALTGLNNLEIGGNNLLRNSADLTKWNKETGVTVTKQNDGYFYIKETDTSKTGRWGIYQDIAVQQNTDYTIAVDGRTNVCFSIGLGTTYGWGNAVVTNEKATKRYVYKFNTGSNTCLRVYLNDQGNAGVYLKCPKLEKGNKATDWTMAIEDWCYNNDITYINGGKIYTGTVTADKLAANSVTADKILAGAITADKLSVDAIMSRNYVKDTSGTKISLADGSYDSKYTKIDAEGKISCQSAEIKGRLSCYGDLELVGGDYQSDGTFVENGKRVEVSTYGSKWGHMLHMGKYDDYLNVIAYDFRACNGAPDEAESGISLRALDASLTNLQNSVSTYYQPFGSSGASLKSGQNLNEFYSGVILGAGMGNAPNDGWWLIVSGGTGGTVTQRAYSLWDGLCYWRYCAAGNWSGWDGNMTSVGVITNALRMPTRASAQTTAKPNVYFDTAGNLYKTSTTSSKRFKEDVKPVENEDLNPENLYDIDVVQFKYKKGHFTNKEDPRYRKDMIGFIAENVYEHYPMAADYHIGDDGRVVCDGWNEQYLIPAMLKLIQNQHMQLINQEMKIKILEDKVMFM